MEFTNGDPKLAPLPLQGQMLCRIFDDKFGLDVGRGRLRLKSIDGLIVQSAAMIEEMELPFLAIVLDNVGIGRAFDRRAARDEGQSVPGTARIDLRDHKVAGAGL